MGDDGAIGLADFEIGPVLGQGGMAVVHRAIFKRTGEVIALKLIVDDTNDPTSRERFRREVKAAMALRHDNICRVIAAGDDAASNRSFMAMELVDGGSVRELKHRFAGTMPVQLAIEIVDQLLSALAVAHRHGVVHRDLKPANLMVTKGGVLKLVDFGIARSSSDHTLTATGMLVGTPAFMSPEQVRGDPVDGRADLFGAGLILHDLLCGRSPYHSDNPATSLVKVLQDDVPGFFDVLFGIDPVIEAFHSKLTAKEPSDRYRDADAARDALRVSIEAVRHRWPTLLADAVREPRRVRQELSRVQADDEVARGHALVARHGAVVAAALAFENATHLDPTHPTAAAELTALASQLELTIDGPSEGAHVDGRPREPRIIETLEALKQTPTHPGLLKRLADLHRASGNIRASARALKRYLRVKDDAVALQQLTVMLWGPGADPALVTGTLQRLRTQDIVAGIKTGGMPAIRPDKPAVVVDATKRAAIAEASRARAEADRQLPLRGHDDDDGIVARLRDQLGMWTWVIGAGVVALVIVLVAARGSTALVKTARADLTRHAEGEVKADEDRVFNVQATKLNEARAALEAGSYVRCSVAATQAFAGESTAKIVLDAKWMVAQCSLLAGDVSSAQDALQDFKDNANIKDKRFELAKTQLAAIARGEVPGGLRKW